MTSPTRDRILTVASELFIEQGYDATSLREIADRLGFTKAALYYHFQSKEQLFAALLEPAAALVRELVERLEDADDIEGWAEALEWVTGKVFENMDIFRLVERNRTAMTNLHETLEFLRDHMTMHTRIEAAVRAKSTSLSDQVRMVAALGAVTGFDDWAPRLLGESPPDQLHAELVAAVRDILRLPREPAAARPRKRSVTATA
jgi:AcrR family transcriptional regulator